MRCSTFWIFGANTWDFEKVKMKTCAASWPELVLNPVVLSCYTEEYWVGMELASFLVRWTQWSYIPSKAIWARLSYYLPACTTCSICRPRLLCSFCSRSRHPVFVNQSILLDEESIQNLDLDFRSCFNILNLENPDKFPNPAASDSKRASWVAFTWVRYVSLFIVAVRVDPYVRNLRR